MEKRKLEWFLLLPITTEPELVNLSQEEFEKSGIEVGTVVAIVHLNPMASC